MWISQKDLLKSDCRKLIIVLNWVVSWEQLVASCDFSISRWSNETGITGHQKKGISYTLRLYNDSLLLRKNFSLDQFYLPAGKKKYCCHGALIFHNCQYIKKITLLSSGLLQGIIFALLQSRPSSVYKCGQVSFGFSRIHVHIYK